MSKLVKFFFLVYFILPIPVYATALEINRDDWLSKLKEAAPNIICKGFLEEPSLEKRMEEIKMDNAKCNSLIPQSFDKCQAQYYAGLPVTLDKETASKWGHTLGQCIGRDFATKYLVTSSSILPKEEKELKNSSKSDDKLELSKDKWLANLRMLAPKTICNSFFDDTGLKKKLEANKINKAQCETLIPISFDKCKTKYYSHLPNNLNSTQAHEWGSKIGQCIGADFGEHHLTKNT